MKEGQKKKEKQCKMHNLIYYLFLRSKKIGCKSKIEVVYKRMTNCFVITKACHQHNHEISSRIYSMLYPQNRINDELKDADLSKIVSLEPKTKN